LRLTNGVTVHLGADREARAFQALSSLEDLGKLISGRDVIVDLRSRSRITVRPDKHGAPATLSTHSS
jgi:cell division protein FtsQ